MEEKWVDIEEWKGLYQVSDMGRVKSLERVTYDTRKGGNFSGKRLCPEKITYGSMHKSTGYMRTILRKDKVKKEVRVHDLVARAFPEICGKWFEGCQVNHKNEDKTDNRAENLEVCTPEYNSNYGTRNERLSKHFRNYSEWSIPVLQYTLEGEFVKEYLSLREAERQTGFKRQNIASCLKGKYKQSYGFIWKYKKETDN